MRPTIALLLPVALVAATVPVAGLGHGPVADVATHRIEAAGHVAGEPAPGFLSGEALPQLPAEAALRIASPVPGEPGNVDHRRAEATLLLRPATAHAAHPLHDDVHEPTELDLVVEWTKDPGLDDEAGATGWRTAWDVTLSASALGEPLELAGAWTPAEVTRTCTLDDPPSTCWHEAAGAVQLTGTWGPADVVLEGAAYDRFCTYSDASSLEGYYDRSADSC